LVSIGDVSSVLFLGVGAVGLLIGASTVAGVVTPLAFVAGIVAWRSTPTSVPFEGAVSGLITTMLVYVGPAVVGICGAAILAVLMGVSSPMPLSVSPRSLASRSWPHTGSRTRLISSPERSTSASGHLPGNI